MKITSLQIGTPQTYSAENGKPLTTSIFRTAVSDPVYLYSDHLENDQPSNRRVHGGPDKAVNVYPGEHYQYWRDALEIPQPENGSFGENFTTSGWLEEEACVGDIYQVGEALVQLSQPRRPCGSLAWRWGKPDFIQVVNRSGRTGWYLRVIKEGYVQAGDEIVLKERPYPEWPVARANTVIMDPKADADTARSLAACPALAKAWVDNIHKALA